MDGRHRRTNYTIFRGTTNVRTSATQLATNMTGTSYNNTAVSGQVYTYWLRARRASTPLSTPAGPSRARPCRASPTWAARAA